MKKKIIFLVSIIICLFSNIKIVIAQEACSKEAVEQLAKIVYKEFGSDFAKDPNDNMFVKLNVASVAINNASRLNGNSWQQKIYNLSDGQYQDHSKYKSNSFEEVVDKSYRGEMAYISALVLSGKYNLPKNIIGQASCKCLLGASANQCIGVDSGLESYDCTEEGWGKEWTHVETINGAFDAYFGYQSGEELSKVDVFNKSASTSVDYYKKLALSYKQTNYSSYTSENVCNKVSKITSNDSSGSDNSLLGSYEHICEIPAVLKVIQFALIILDILKIIIPIALIILGIIDFSKSVITNDEKLQKKSVNLFFKRLLYAVLVFIVPWLIEVLTITLGNLIGDTEATNFTDCLENANKDTIKKIEDGTFGMDCYVCKTDETLKKYGKKAPTRGVLCKSWKKTDLSKEECTSNIDIDSEDDNKTNKYNYIIYVGDSRTVGMCNTVTLKENENCTVAEVGMGYYWLNSESIKNKINSIITNHPNSYIVINMGTNSALTSSEGKEYAKLYNEFATKYPNSKVVAISVTQIDSVKAKENGLYYGVSINDNSVSTFNSGLKSNLNPSVSYCDIYSKMENYNYTAIDGVHYNNDTYKFIYDEIQKCLK